MLLRLADPQQVERVDWDSITFSLKGDDYWPTRNHGQSDQPARLHANRLRTGFPPSATLEEALEILGARADSSDCLIAR